MNSLYKCVIDTGCHNEMFNVKKCIILRIINSHENDIFHVSGRKHFHIKSAMQLDI